MRSSATLFTVLLFALTPAGLAQWVQTSGPEGGYVNALAEDDSFLYAATWGHVFRMHHGETAWTPVSELAPWEVSATSLVTRGAALIAGTPGAGVFRTTDRGVTWHRWESGLTGAEYLSCFALRGDDLFAGTNCGVYRSTDGGRNWTASNAGQDSLGVISLLVKDTVLFSGTMGGGVFRSTDGGASWTPASTGLDADWVWSLVALDSAIFAATWQASGVYRSTDDGTTWDSVNYGLLNNDVCALTVLDTTLFAGTFGGVCLSTDRGERWYAAYKYPDKIVTCFHHSAAGFFAGSFDGTFHSTNGGQSWYPVGTGLIGTVINTLLRTGTRLFAGTEDGGLRRSDDDGASWVEVPVFGRTVRALAAGGMHIFAATSGGLSRSTDGGNSWTVIDQPLKKGNFTSFALIPGRSGGTDLFAGTDSAGVVLSTDDGENWTPVNTGLTDTTVRRLAVVDSSLFAGTGSGVFRSTDRGATWVPVSAGLSDSAIQCFAVSGATLFAGTERGGVFRTSDRGAHWTAVNNGFPGPNVTCMEAQGTRLFAAGAGRGALFLSENNGDAWTPVDTGMIHLQLLALEASDSTLFAGTRGAGVWRRPLREMVTVANDAPVAVPLSVALEQNYPNPFNPGTLIRYELPAAVDVRLTVYDVLGREVALLVNERKPAGRHSVRFQAPHLAAGVYVYRLVAGPSTITRKCLLLK